MNPLDQIIAFLKQVDELETAKTLLSTFQKYSSSIEQYDQLGRLFHDVKGYSQSIECTEKSFALSRTPNELYATRSNLAKLYNHINRPDKSLQYIKANLDVNPTDYEMMMEKVFSLYLSSNFQASQQLTEQLLHDSNTPDNIRKRCEFNYGSYLLDQDRFKEGLIGFIDIGHQIGIWPKYNYPGPQWCGEITPGKNIAILAEGGIGDEIINIRFIKHIEKLGMNAYFVSNRAELIDIFNRNNLRSVGSVKDVPADSEFILSMYLPIALNLEPEDLWYGPYLTPDDSYVEKWKHILPTGDKVAVRWSGNPYYEQDLHRSVPLTLLSEYLNFDNPNINFISVQKDNYTGIEEYPVMNVADELSTLEDLIACLSLMNYTVTSCTSVAHVAAACGFPLTVLPPVATYYTWLGHSKWYGADCTILRQTNWNDWTHMSQIKLEELI